MANALWPTGQQEEDVFGKTIIIVEDDPSNAEVLHLLLQFADRSYQVTCFRSGDEVLANVDIITSLHPVLFVLDYQLPSMTALELCKRLRAMEGLENVPMIILSGSRISDAEKERMGHLGLLFIPKPYDIDDLLTTIARVIP
jgi:CheY-like chemotaxis protein